MKDWKTTKQLTLVNLKNDLTPCENIAMVSISITYSYRFFVSLAKCQRYQFLLFTVKLKRNSMK